MPTLKITSAFVSGNVIIRYGDIDTANAVNSWANVFPVKQPALATNVKAKTLTIISPTL